MAFNYHTNPAFARAAQAHFFQAMREGYAKHGVGKQTIPGLPGSKSIVWERGPWKVADTYFVSSHFLDSTGLTLIYYESDPVWVMHYGGWYEDEAIPFLKKCLADAYNANEFHGGRGRFFVQERTEHGWLHYHNQFDFAPGSFENFSGRETIFSYQDQDDGHELGHHWYRGHVLATAPCPS